MVLGCDIGTAFTKAVVLDGSAVAFQLKTPTEANPMQAIGRVFSEIRNRVDPSPEELELVVTGWGQSKVTVPCQTASTLNCLAKAAAWYRPGCAGVLCLGAQQSVALSVGPTARVLEYRENDKCASGAGRFLEIIFEALECTVEESAEIARRADQKISMSSQCAVFAESEVVSLVNDGVRVENIVEAIFQALAKSVVSLSKKIKLKDPVVVGGGLANNGRIAEILRGELKREMRVFEPAPDYMAAVGAALSAQGGGR